jgi:hypothetical protein
MGAEPGPGRWPRPGQVQAAGPAMDERPGQMIAARYEERALVTWSVRAGPGLPGAPLKDLSAGDLRHWRGWPAGTDDE